MKNLNQVNILRVLDNSSKLDKWQQVNCGFTKSQNKASVKELGGWAFWLLKKKKYWREKLQAWEKNKGTNIGFWGAF